MTEEKFTNQNNQLERERERERQNLAKIEEFTKKHKEWENANSAANTFGFSLGLIIGLLILVTIWVFLKTLFGESFESFFEKWGGWFVTAAFVLLFFIIVLTVQILKKFNEPEPTLSEPEKEKAES